MVGDSATAIRFADRLLEEGVCGDLGRLPDGRARRRAPPDHRHGRAHRRRARHVPGRVRPRRPRAGADRRVTRSRARGTRGCSRIAGTPGRYGRPPLRIGRARLPAPPPPAAPAGAGGGPRPAARRAPPHEPLARQRRADRRLLRRGRRTGDPGDRDHRPRRLRPARTRPIPSPRSPSASARSATRPRAGRTAGSASASASRSPTSRATRPRSGSTWRATRTTTRSAPSTSRRRLALRGKPCRRLGRRPDVRRDRGALLRRGRGRDPQRAVRHPRATSTT